MREETSNTVRIAEVYPPVTFASTIPREFVHRAALCEVFLTDVAELGDREFLCAAQLPRQHAYFSDTVCEPPLFDALLLMETVRQAAFVGAHKLFSVPTTDKFILPGISLTIEKPGELLRGSQPGELSIHTTVTSARIRDGQCTGLDYEMRLSLAGQVVATAGTGMRMRSPGAYKRMRAEHRAGRDLLAEDAVWPVPVAPARVGRVDPVNVVLGDARVLRDEVAATVVVSLSHPSLFDHPQDHIPGMVLAEAGRQLALLAASECCGLSPAKSYLSRWSATFTRFGELEVPTSATASVNHPVIDPDGRVHVPVSLSFAQDLGEICTATATISTHPVMPPIAAAADPGKG